MGKTSVLVLCCTACLAALLASAEVAPGLRTTISNGALDYIRSVMQPTLVKEVLNVKIPDVNTKVKSPIGKIKASLSQIKVTQFSIGHSSVSVSPDSLVTVSLTNVAVHVTMRWHYKTKILIRDSGHADVTTSTAHTKIVVRMGRDATTGAPTATIVSTDFDVGNLKIKLHGGASWLYNIFIKHFRGKIQSAVNNQVRSKMSTTVQTLLKNALATIPLSVNFGNGMSLAYPLADAPSVLGTYGGRLVLGSVAESYATKEGRGKSPYKPTSMPKTTATSAPGPMLEVFVNDYALNTFSYAFVHSGQADWKFDKSKASADKAKMFVTGYYETIAPQLVQKYGKTANIRLDLSVSQPPKVIFQPDGFNLQTAASLVLQVSTGSTFARAFGLTLTIGTKGTAALKGTSLTGKLSVLNVTATLSQSEVGNVDVNAMHDVVSYTASLATDLVNTFLAKGIPLPVIKGFTFTSPQLRWGANYLAVITGFTYKP